MFAPKVVRQSCCVNRPEATIHCTSSTWAGRHAYLEVGACFEREWRYSVQSICRLSGPNDKWMHEFVFQTPHIYLAAAKPIQLRQTIQPRKRRPSICLFIISPFLHPSIHPSIHHVHNSTFPLSINSSMNLSICLSTNPSTCRLCTHPFVRPLVCPSYNTF